MTDKDVKKLRGAIREEVRDVVKEELGTALKPIGDRLGKVETRLGKVEVKVGKVGKKLNILWEQVEKVTFGLEDVKETLDFHTEVLKRIEAKIENNSDDVHKLNKRVSKTEDKLGIIPSPELTL